MTGSGARGHVAATGNRRPAPPRRDDLGRKHRPGIERGSSDCIRTRKKQAWRRHFDTRVAVRHFPRCASQGQSEWDCGARYSRRCFRTAFKSCAAGGRLVAWACLPDRLLFLRSIGFLRRRTVFSLSEELTPAPGRQGKRRNLQFFRPTRCRIIKMGLIYSQEQNQAAKRRVNSEAEEP